VSEWSPPVVLPPAWKCVEIREDGAAYRRKGGLSAIISCDVELDGKEWVHLSVSHRNRLPSWNELHDGKEIFLGDTYAYLIFPPKKFYINIHPYALHVFTCRNGPQLPEFSRGSGLL